MTGDLPIQKSRIRETLPWKPEKTKGENKIKRLAINIFDCNSNAEPATAGIMDNKYVTTKEEINEINIKINFSVFLKTITPQIWLPGYHGPHGPSNYTYKYFK